MKNLESQTQLRSFTKVLQLIQENQKQKQESVENVIMISIKLIEQLQKDLYQLKSNVVQQLDYLNENVNEWIKQVLIIGQQNVTYSFYDELDKLINQKKLDEFNEKLLIDQINKINQSWNQKFNKKLILFKQFKESQKCEEILQKLGNINEINIREQIMNEIQLQLIQDDNEQNQFSQQLMMYKQVQFKLIDDSNQQIGYCQAIVFNKDGSIMVSSNNCEIRIWNFEQGRFKLSNSYNKHTNPVYCMVYSKQKNSFISGGGLQEIFCWQQINKNEWKCSQPFKQHKDQVYCLILNKQEDQLISGGLDCRIIVWQVDFIKNDLTFLYSLDKHSNIVFSISLNQSETVLASCGYHELIIWGKESQGKWEFKYKQSVSAGQKIHFINNQQFLWVPLDKQIDDLLEFELQNGVFKQNQDKTITLIKNHECEDCVFFPIIHNKDRNVILIRHKHHIYLIRQLNDGKFKILASINCQDKESYGTMTNNGQYLVFWDNKSKKYSSYEILYQ
ncbi:unnamed protein product [Paramecium pentaurelia]|uniref:WD40-repeat-containing domain n=1 Tax=Paramecium pentaurelia TaxID=43138 RepID=A0A8S1WMX0_9CILI|nr:unnamed protein product [Paramecium pentaurelia]